MNISRLLLVCTILFASSISVQAQFGSQCAADPPSCHPLTTTTYGAALSHAHNAFDWDHAQYCGRWLIADSANNGGNAFFGNTICVDNWLNGPTWYYYDWSADPNAASKIATWEATRPTPIIFVVYDTNCLMATYAGTQSPF